MTMRLIQSHSLTRFKPCYIAALCGLVLADPALAQIITPGATLVPVHSEAKFFEGPSWAPYRASLYFSSLTGSGELYRLTPPAAASVWMPSSQLINGTFLAIDGRLLCCQGQTRRILSLGIGRTAPEDPVVLAENLTWPMPNDICQTPNGHIYFTTPDFDQRLNSAVWHLPPGGPPAAVVTDMPLCNGLITSLDGSTLYVGDSYLKWWRSYPILPDGSVGTGSLFFNPATADQNDPDGMTIDEFGNLYFCGRGGVWVVSPQGQQLEFVPVPEFCTNVTFGGEDGHTLYITCDQRVYSLAMEVRGALWQGVPESNQPPQVNAGPDLLTTTYTSSIFIDATVTDDHLPDPPATTSVKWTQLSGPGTVVLDDDTSTDTMVTFPAPGAYAFELRAFDGIRVATDSMKVAVVRAADLDNDTDVDADDGAALRACLTGADLGLPGGCDLADVDRDGDADMTDFGLLQGCLSGPGTAADPSCAL
jgi:gluconolactonase